MNTREQIASVVKLWFADEPQKPIDGLIDLLHDLLSRNGMTLMERTPSLRSAERALMLAEEQRELAKRIVAIEEELADLGFAEAPRKANHKAG